MQPDSRDLIWLKTKHFKTGEYRKLSARRNGPWTIVRKMPNGVNFTIRNEKTSEEKVVHHDRLSPVKKWTKMTSSERDCGTMQDNVESDDYSSSSSDTCSSASHSDYSLDTDTDDTNSDNENVDRRYPNRHRRQRVIPGAIPWASLHM